MITKKQLLDSIKKLQNPQDKLIVAGIFYGLYGNVGYDTLRNLKKSDVDFDNNTIMVEGNAIHMDAELKEIVSKAIAQEIYIVANNTSSKTVSEYRLNSDSEYLIPTRPMASTKNGTVPMGYSTTKARVKSCINLAGLDCSVAEIRQSGAYHLLAEQKFNWTITEAEQMLRKNGLSIRRNNLAKMIKQLKNNA